MVEGRIMKINSIFIVYDGDTSGIGSNLPDGHFYVMIEYETPLLWVFNRVKNFTCDTFSTYYKAKKLADSMKELSSFKNVPIIEGYLDRNTGEIVEKKL